MIRLNRTSEYGLMALSHIRQKSQQAIPPSVTSTREIADKLGLPFEILAKTMQKLRDHNLIASTHGTKGGYVLIRDLGQVSLADYLAAMEGDIDVVDCCRHQEMGPSVDRCKNSFNGHRGGEAQTTKACPYMENCNIREPMVALNSKMSLFLKTVSLAELLEP